MTFTTLPSPSRIPCIFPVAFLHMKKFPSSEPDVTYSSLGPRKFTKAQRSGLNERTVAVEQELTVFHSCYIAVPEKAGTRKDHGNVAMNVKVRSLTSTVTFIFIFCIRLFRGIISE